MKWLLIACVTVLSVVGYMACMRMNVERVNPVIKKSLVKWESKGDNTSATQLTKDSLGRITSLENESELNTFRFSTDSLLLTEYAKAEKRVVYTFKGKLGKGGQLTGGIAVAAYDANRPDTVLHRFEYDEDGYLVKEFRDYGKAGTYIIAYTYKNGDAIMISTWYNNVLYNTKELEYYTERGNLTGLESFKFRNNMNKLAGKTSRHLVKKIRSIAGNGKLNYAFDYEYETDEIGLPLKLIAKKGKKVSTVTAYYYDPNS